MNGSEWPLGAAPQMVMAPVPGFPFNVRDFVAHHIEDIGFTGVLRYLQMEGVGPDDLLLATLADEMGFWVHFVMYGDAQSGTAPEDSLGFSHNQAYQIAVIDALAPFRNVSIGLGFDNDEWVSDNEGNRWVKRNEERAPGRLFSIRVRPDEARRHPTDFDKTVLGWRPGGVCSLEQQIIVKSELALNSYCDEAIWYAADLVATPRPVFSADRFRVRPGDRPKDFTMDEIVATIPVFMERNVAAAYGIGARVSDTGSEKWPVPYRDQLRAVLKGTPVPPPQPLPPGEDMTTVDLATLQMFRVTAHEGEDFVDQWQRHSHWPLEQETILVRRTNDTADTFVLYAIHRSSTDTEFVEPRINPSSGESGKILFADEGTLTILPVGIRVPPGGEFEGKFDKLPGLAHGSITFYCYREVVPNG